MTRRAPCPSCPWKRSTPRHGFPGGCINVRKLHAAIHGNAFEPAMQCHATPDGPTAQVCVGFALVVGFNSAPLRMAALLERYNPEDIEPTSEPLHTPRSMVLFHGGV